MECPYNLIQSELVFAVVVLFATYRFITHNGVYYSVFGEFEDYFAFDSVIYYYSF